MDLRLFELQLLGVGVDRDWFEALIVEDSGTSTRVVSTSNFVSFSRLAPESSSAFFLSPPPPPPPTKEALLHRSGGAFPCPFAPEAGVGIFLLLLVDRSADFDDLIPTEPPGGAPYMKSWLAPHPRRLQHWMSLPSSGVLREERLATRRLSPDPPATFFLVRSSMSTPTDQTESNLSSRRFLSRAGLCNSKREKSISTGAMLEYAQFQVIEIEEEHHMMQRKKMTAFAGEQYGFVMDWVRHGIIHFP